MKSVATVCLISVFLLTSSASGGVFTESFSLRASGIGTPSLASLLTVNGTRDINNVQFDFSLSILGSRTDGLSVGLNTNSFGLGVTSPMETSGDLQLTGNETLRFSMSVSNVQGGNVDFLGFSSLNTNGATGSERITLSADPFFQTDFDNLKIEGPDSSTSVHHANGIQLSTLTNPFLQRPRELSVFGGSLDGNDRFRVADIAADFDVVRSSQPTIVPEPSTIAAFGLLGVAAFRGRRRSRMKTVVAA